MITSERLVFRRLEAYRLEAGPVAFRKAGLAGFPRSETAKRISKAIADNLLGRTELLGILRPEDLAYESSTLPSPPSGPVTDSTNDLHHKCKFLAILVILAINSPSPIHVPVLLTLSVPKS